MKYLIFLNCLMLLLPFQSFAHPGHATGTSREIAAGAVIGLLLIAIGLLYRRSSRADD